MEIQRKSLILSVGYGEGHHAAAHALCEELLCRGWRSRVVDICKEATPFAFHITQKYYQLCVRRLPWLWGITYAQTETPDWGETVRIPVVSRSLHYLRQLLEEENPDIIFCTYPLFAYMLDALKKMGMKVGPYVVVVTDALEISRPWMKTKAPMVCVPDEKSRQIVLDRYGLEPSHVLSTDFPVKRAFQGEATRTSPSFQDFKIVYGAYAPTRRVCRDIRAILSAIPGSKITVIAGNRKLRLERYLYQELQGARLTIVERTSEMHTLFLDSHLYIGKAGAATMFEAYAARIPIVVNYALPGQEQGNLQLLLDDGAGCFVESTQELIATLDAMLGNDAARWKSMQKKMDTLSRGNGTTKIVDAVERRFFS